MPSDCSKSLKMKKELSSIVNGRSGALNYLVIIIAKGWLLRSFQDGILAQSECKSLIIPSPLFPSFFPPSERLSFFSKPPKLPSF